MQDFAGKVAVITGGASGIGLSMAKRFAAEGMSVVIGDVEKAALDAAVAQIDGAIGVPTDVTDPKQMEALAEAAVDAHGGVHVFCNNAGVGGGGLSWETSLASWEWVIGVNLWGVIHGVRTFVPLLLQQPESHIVNTASVAGLVAAPFMGPYNASKHAVVAISETLHHEFALTGASTKVSVLCPGWVNTKIGESERNRPEHLSDAVTEEQQAAGEMMRGVLQAQLEAGMHPDEVAQRVLDAIREERFWIQTHADAGEDMWMTAVNRRLDSARDRTNPAMNFLA